MLKKIPKSKKMGGLFTKFYHDDAIQETENVISAYERNPHTMFDVGRSSATIHEIKHSFKVGVLMSGFTFIGSVMCARHPRTNPKANVLAQTLAIACVLDFIYMYYVGTQADKAIRYLRRSAERHRQQ